MKKYLVILVWFSKGQRNKPAHYIWVHIAYTSSKETDELWKCIVLQVPSLLANPKYYVDNSLGQIYRSMPTR